ncbi:MAG TPA: DUF2189 domain-containing protein [Steroidobacteraceae bacterium]|nr:DUF2189 domain-containing protein [Steroidobacteraceae bacterium]
MSTEANSPPTGSEPLPFVAPCRSLSISRPFDWVRLGWKDLVAAPRQSLLYGLLFALLGALLAFFTWRLGLLALYVGLASGFVFVGPFLAMGLYSISYQLEQGHVPTLLFSVREGRAHLRETLVLGVCLLILLLIWGRAAMVMSVFLPSAAAPSLSDLIPYLSIGTLVGAVFCSIVFAATAFSVPMLLDRRADAITAVITSINATLRNKGAMLVWALIIVAAVVIGFATLFSGFVILMPLLGHATWHAYRNTIDASLWPTTHP